MSALRRLLRKLRPVWTECATCGAPIREPRVFCNRHYKTRNGRCAS